MKRVLAIGALICALTGCGTVQNFRRESPVDATVYGGAKIAVDRFNDDPMAVTLMFPVWLADLFLSAVGDTITLPVTISLSMWRTVVALRELNRPEEPRTMHNKWREFWFNDQPGHKIPERVHGGIY